ncbi:MAG: nucleotide exchange factor GrpE, partial [Solirubrobacteraceae bacterium]|nr:nucleotide exchange factor GrpE [Solirubrobacteraceae bacterium]
PPPPPPATGPPAPDAPPAGNAGQPPAPTASPDGAAAPTGAAATDAGVAADAEAEPDPAELRERAAKADEYLALAQRTQADFENYRKRTTRDVRAAEARGTSRLARELLPALDNLERALAAVEASGDDEEHHLTQGIRLVQSELSAALTRSGIEGYVPKGERFDPVEHEAVAQQPFEGFEPGTIVEVLQAGYRLHDAVLRPARVVVAG